MLPDSHVLRPQPAADPEELFWSRYHDTMRTNDQWAEELATKVADQARSAPCKRFALLQQSWELAKADIRSDFCGKPMTLGQLRAQYGSGANMACRPIQRHGVVQGKKLRLLRSSSLDDCDADEPRLGLTRYCVVKVFCCSTVTQ